MGGPSHGRKSDQRGTSRRGLMVEAWYLLRLSYWPRITTRNTLGGELPYKATRIKRGSVSGGEETQVKLKIHREGLQKVLKELLGEGLTFQP